MTTPSISRLVYAKFINRAFLLVLQGDQGQTVSNCIYVWLVCVDKCLRRKVETDVGQGSLKQFLRMRFFILTRSDNEIAVVLFKRAACAGFYASQLAPIED